LSLKQGEDVLHTARVVVGKPESPTPIFSDRMRFLVVNPSWTMPPSILKKEALPNLAADPDYYAKRGYEVIRRGDRVTVRQPPGERNALGHIKFMFPNDHSVYLHDTPSRGLFGRDARAFSHGCVRVDQPFRLAEAVLGGDWTERRLRGMVGRGERTINLNQPLPIHLTYFTAYVGEDGRLRLRDDLYGFSRRLRVAMGLER
jgi:murein L,D-transpeptidase YcbB/YkuD